MPTDCPPRGSLEVSKIFRRHYLKWRRAEGTRARLAFREADWNAFLRHKRERGWDSVLEFGCGLSTILFSHLLLRVVSLETDSEFAKRVEAQCEPTAVIYVWDNKSISLREEFDFAFVDGILPRIPQAHAAMKHARFIFVHDPGGSGRGAIPHLIHLKEHDSYSPYMRLFENG